MTVITTGESTAKTAESAAAAMLHTLEAWGVDRVFICPGSTEAAFLDASLKHPGVELVLTTHEAITVSAADAYARVSGRPVARRQTTWLKPMSGQRTRGKGGEAPPLTATDYVVVAVVILAIAAFEIWFFFYAGSSLDGRSGR